VVYCLFGLPAALTQWLLHVVANLIEEAHGAVHIAPIVYLEDLRKSWADRDGRPVLIFSDIPEAKLSQVVATAGVPTVVAHDDMQTALYYAIASRDIDLRQGIRFLSQSYATLETVFTSPRAAAIGPRAYSQRLRHFLPEIADHYHISLSQAALERLCARLIGQGGEAGEETVRANIARHIPVARKDIRLRLDAAGLALAHSVLDCYEPMTQGRRIERVALPCELMPDWDRPGRYLGGPIDLTGPRRLLTAGHALHLPVGRWRAVALLSVADNFSGNELEVDVLLGDVSLGGVSAPLPAFGGYTFAFEFETSDAFPPLQTRVVLNEGAIEGELTLVEVVFERL
jgi:hypothetical protein